MLQDHQKHYIAVLKTEGPFDLVAFPTRLGQKNDDGSSLVPLSTSMLVDF